MKRTTARTAPLLAVPLLLLAASCHGGPPAVAANLAQGPLVMDKSAGGAARPALGFALAEAPLSLTASDGTGLRLASLDAEAVVDGGLAFTELRLVFENPEDRTLEGTFRAVLPEKASLGRFAMKIGREWQEGEVVELAAARRAYEDFLHRKQDPALLEKAAGNEFSARVFPIPARGRKEILVSWVSEIEGDRYVLPLRGLPELGTLDAKVTVRGAKTAPTAIHVEGKAPTADVVVPVAGDSGERLTAIRSGELALVRVRPDPASRPDPLGSTVVLLDTSASRALGFDAELEALDRLARQVAATSGTLVVVGFDQRATELFRGRAADFGAGDVARIRSRGALGASDLERALGVAATSAGAVKAKRVVLLGDGVSTAGATEAARLAEAVKKLRAAGVERLDAVALGGIRDDEALRRLVRGGLARDGVVVRADQADALRRLGEATRSGVAVRVPGANWSWPTTLDGVQAGDTFSVYVELPEKAPLTVALDGKPAETVSARVTERPLLERAVAEAQVGSMLARQASGKEDLRKAITSLATRNRILTPYTAMLVLETEQDYARYGIDRRSLGDVLAIEGGRVGRVHREAPVALAAATPIERPAPRKDAPRRRGSPETPAQAGPPGGSSAEARLDDDGAAPAPAPASMAARDEVANAPPPPPPPAATSVPRRALPEMKKAAAPAAEAARADTMAPMLGGAVAGGVAGGASSGVAAARRPVPRPVVREEMRDQVPEGDDLAVAAEPAAGKREKKAPYEGRFATVMELIERGRAPAALDAASAWHAENPGDVLALMALGEAAEATGDLVTAERAYGSLIDLFPNRADLRRLAGQRLERIAARSRAEEGPALDLALDTFEKALADRPDHPESHRLVTYVLVRRHEWARAFDVAVAATKQAYPAGRFRGVERILAEDVGLVGAAWAAAEPGRRAEIEQRVRSAGSQLETEPSLRFVLSWETDANDVDFHIHDGRGGHAYYSQPHLGSGGDLYADVTTGYGPECFTIRGARRAGPYTLEAHYYSRGPMGYGMGKLEVVDHDGKGHLSFEERPFLVMVDQAFVDLGTVR